MTAKFRMSPLEELSDYEELFFFPGAADELKSDGQVFI